MLLVLVVFDGLRVDFDNSYFIVICKNDEQFYLFKMIFFILLIQYVFFSLFVLFVNIYLVRIVWSLGKNSVMIVVKDLFQVYL